MTEILGPPELFGAVWRTLAAQHHAHETDGHAEPFESCSQCAEKEEPRRG